jgi:diaminopimelate epimerase
MKFLKYHALGNDYLVRSRTETFRKPTSEEVRLICSRNFGLGSDGLLLESIPRSEANFGLRIFNPDGSEAEKSGNGLRIFARYLFDHELVQYESFTIETIGGIARCKICCPREKIEIEMGKAEFLNSGVVKVKGVPYPFEAVSMGNPHCVIVCNELSEDLIKSIGPDIESDSIFPNRTNVQLLRILDGNNVQIEIWERGAGYTLASGSSASAAAAVAYKSGKCERDINVHMPGGVIHIHIGKDYEIMMTGPTTYVGQFIINSELFDKKALHLR